MAPRDLRDRLVNGMVVFHGLPLFLGPAPSGPRTEYTLPKPAVVERERPAGTGGSWELGGWARGVRRLGKLKVSRLLRGSLELSLPWGVGLDPLPIVPARGWQSVRPARRLVWQLCAF